MSYNLDKEILTKMRSVDGFPIGSIEDIIDLSDPPHYTACPNPWIEDFIKENGKLYDSKTDKYHREPFTTDVSEGKSDIIFKAHSYHTKIPPKAIIRYILHYTQPNDIVFDGFCGTGMTGIACQMCGFSDFEFKSKIEKENSQVKWGMRKSILCDISPISTFIAFNYNNPIAAKKFKKIANQILQTIEDDVEWMYETQHVSNGIPQFHEDIERKKKPILGKINYIVLSDIFICPQCTDELIFSEIAIGQKGEVKLEFACSNCKVILKKKDLKRSWESMRDESTGEVLQCRKQVPVLINYTVNEDGKFIKHEKKPDEFDFNILKKINDKKIPYWFPSYPMMFKGIKWGDSWRSGYHAGITNVHHFFTKRQLYTLSVIFNKLQKLDPYMKSYMIYTFEQTVLGMSKLARYVPTHYSQVNQYLSGTLYIGSQIVETSVSYIMKNKIKQLTKVLEEIKNYTNKNLLITTQSSTNIPNIPDQSVDYIFTDPPFGSNLLYSELNFLWESWLKVFTNIKNEAIENNSQNKDLQEYQEIMERCFKENYRILKPGRWMTVVFHNSQNKVWIAIQEALQRAGFVVADVRTLDKIQGSFKQIISSRAVKQDLVISTYKPSGGLDQYFGGLSSGTEEGVWKFLDTHLKQLPTFVEKNRRVEIITERQNYLLFDRMIAFHVQKGLTVPISAAEFYEKLQQKYPERDGMYFLSEQIPEYDQKRAKAKSVKQATIFVEDEKSSILWLNEQLKTPQTYQDVQPKFLKELHQSKYEKLPELSEILEQNFLQDKDDKWFIPDPSKQKDLEQLREKSLVREFQSYNESKGKLKQFRLESIRAGFRKCWSDNNYKTIVDIAKRLPENVIQEDNNLLMYYDNASSRL